MQDISFISLIRQVVGPVPQGLEFMEYIVGVFLLIFFLKYTFMIISIPFNLKKLWK